MGDSRGSALVGRPSFERVLGKGLKGLEAPINWLKELTILGQGPYNKEKSLVRSRNMARVTIEDCVVNIPNRFLLVQAAIRRTRQIMEGSKPLTGRRNREVILALREIADGKVRPVLDPSKAVPFDQGLMERQGMASGGSLFEEVSTDHMGPAGVDSGLELEELEHGFHEVEADNQDEG